MAYSELGAASTFASSRDLSGSLLTLLCLAPVSLLGQHLDCTSSYGDESLAHAQLPHTIPLGSPLSPRAQRWLCPFQQPQIYPRIRLELLKRSCSRATVSIRLIRVQRCVAACPGSLALVQQLKPLDSIQFSRSAAKRQSVMALPSIKYLQVSLTSFTEAEWGSAPMLIDPVSTNTLNWASHLLLRTLRCFLRRRWTKTPIAWP